MIVITNGTEYIYLDEEHQIQKTTDISKAKTFTFKGCSIFIRENVKATKGFYAYDTETQRMILSRLVDTFSSRILYPMLLLSGNHSIAVV